ncbi:MAG: heme A synthase [Alphaproteobacteria bacterium]|nr:COX15/CtaA family protein [Alphaproteobacteria bacterium]TAD87898.1 MAG: heme A synthase [Alphaproteobacteria bacterium]
MTAAAPTLTTAAPSISNRAEAARVAVATWLFAVAGLVFAMVVIGGITRLTESGLSIVRWEPISGVLPPLTEADWQRLLELYRESPQYRQVNRGMTIEEFKTIFWWEYIHRVWGRLIGIAFLVPYLWFLATGRIQRQWRLPLFGLFVLGGLQGAIGWWMVASGLRDVPWVSPYRLTTHLGLALVIFACLLWVGLSHLREAGRWGTAAASPGVRWAARWLWVPVAVTILSGGFVAGLDAGLIYNEFPWMGDGLVPPDYRNPALGLIANALEHHPAVQFHHRVLAISTVVLALAFAWTAQRSSDGVLRGLGLLVAAAALMQMTLGIATLLAHVPVSLGAAHQGGAVVVLAAVMVAWHRVSGQAAARPRTA